MLRVIKASMLLMAFYFPLSNSFLNNYVVETVIPANYTPDAVEDLTVTNTYASPLSDVTAVKAWSGGSDRPEVTFQLYRKVGTEAETVLLPVKLNGVVDDNELTPWNYTWKNLPTHRQADGLLYTYYVVETGVPAYYAPDTVDDLIVTNTHLLSTVTVSKVVTGNMGDLDKNFSFTATLKNYAGAPIEFPLPPVGSGYTLSADKLTATFDLKHDEDVTLLVPVGASLTVVESDNTGYTTSVRENGGAATNGASKTMTVPVTDATLQFTNAKEAIVDTGVGLDTLPYMLILVLIGTGGAANWIGKRKHYFMD